MVMSAKLYSIFQTVLLADISLPLSPLNGIERCGTGNLHEYVLCFSNL